MTDNMQVLTAVNRQKALDALGLLQASLDKLPAYHPETVQTPDQQEPYDALSDRFMRATETCLKFFRSYERYMYGETSDTVRDLLNRTEKTGLISSVQKWMEMRDTRNRIVRDYLPEQVKKLYDLIMFDYGKELQDTRRKIEEIDL